MDRATLSTTFGSLSFTIWLFAQSPQIYENYRRGSVDGLSPVFLSQWMLGDVTNVVGCILTAQLPFQIAVATYFCCIDLCIMGQYAYYWRRGVTKKKDKGKARRVGGSVGPFAIETSELIGKRNRSPTTTIRPGNSRSASVESAHTVTYWALRDAAMSVAQLAEEAARQKRERSTSRSSSVRVKGKRGHEWTAHTLSPTREQRGSNTESDDEVPAHMTASESSAASSPRMRRSLVLTEEGQRGRTQATRPSGSRTRSTASMKRSFGMAFMGVFLLSAICVEAAPISLFGAQDSPSWQRIIGRMSAWTCTVLYMTSRIPQIWENYMRKSVDGLSSLLFIAAFLGNLAYSLSVLTSPDAVGQGSAEYLQESIPFLLGSGGTLIFDATIMLQFLLWKGKSKEQERPQHRHRHRLSNSVILKRSSK